MKTFRIYWIARHGYQDSYERYTDIQAYSDKQAEVHFICKYGMPIKRIVELEQQTGNTSKEEFTS